jgi:hypothetical protein
MNVLPSLDVLVNLMQNPGLVYISGDQKALYASNGTDVFQLVGPDFSTMSPEEIDAYVFVSFNQ